MDTKKCYTDGFFYVTIADMYLHDLKDCTSTQCWPWPPLPVETDKSILSAPTSWWRAFTEMRSAVTMTGND